MNDHRNDENPARGGLPPALATDLEALRETTGRNLPSLERTTRRLRDAVPQRRGGPVRWRWAAAGAFGCALLVAALLLPVDYQRVIGSDVHFTLSARHLEPAAAERAAREFGETFGASEVVVRPSFASDRLELSAHSGQRRPALVRAAASLLADALADEGFQVQQETRLVKAEVRGRVADLMVAAALAQAAGLPPNVARELARKDTSIAVAMKRLEAALRRDGIEGASVTKSPDGRHVRMRLRPEALPKRVFPELRDVMMLMDHDRAVRDPAAQARNDSLRLALYEMLRAGGFEVTDTTRAGKRALILRLRPLAPGESRPRR